MWHIDGKSLRFDFGPRIEFEFPIRQAAEVANVVVVVLDVPSGVVMTENAFGASTAGSRLWQVERSPGIAVVESNCYMDVRPNDDSSVVLGNWHGIDVVVDVRTGRIRESSITK